jgi:hypothetical protein
VTLLPAAHSSDVNMTCSARDIARSFQRHKEDRIGAAEGAGCNRIEALLEVSPEGETPRGDIIHVQKPAANVASKHRDEDGKP